MRKLFLSCAVLMLIGPWAAQADGPVDPDANSLGLYFDTEGTQMEAWSDPFQPVEMYVVLTRPTFDAIYGLEYGITFDGMFVASVHAVNGGGIIDPPAWDNFILGWLTPMPVSEATWLVHIGGLYIDATQGPVTFRLHGSIPSSLPGNLPVALLADGVLQQLTTPVAPGAVCAQINGEEGIIAIEGAYWGAVKSLYR